MQIKRNFSAKREAIFQALASSRVHPSAEWLYEHLKPSLPDLSLGTVYRNLTVFKQNGTVRSLGVFNGQERFDADLSPHSHFVCQGCFSIMDVPAGKALIESSVCSFVEKECGVTVISHNVVFYGFCRQCAQKGISNGSL